MTANCILLLVHQSFLKSDSPPPFGNVIEQGRPLVSCLTQSDEDEDELAPHQDGSLSSSEESDLSSAEEGSSFSGDSTGAPQTGKRGSGQSSSSEDQSDLGALEKRGPGNPPKGPWSAVEEALIRSRMATQLQIQGNLEIPRETAMELSDILPRRSESAIRNKWRALKNKATQSDLGRIEGKMTAHNARGKAQVEDPERKKRYKEDSGSMVEDDDSEDNDSKGNGVNRDSHKFASTPGQSQAVKSSGSRSQSQPMSSTWSPSEHASIFKSTKGLQSNQIDWGKVRARLPDPSRRTADACRSYWRRKIQPVLRLDEGTLSNVPHAIPRGKRHIYRLATSGKAVTKPWQAEIRFKMEKRVRKAQFPAEKLVLPHPLHRRHPLSLT